MKCAECGEQMVLRETRKFTYPQSGKPRKFWGCSAYPECMGSHGAHPDGTPLGVPADTATKALRVKAHARLEEVYGKHGYFDFVAECLGLSKERAHIAMLDKDQLVQLLRSVD